MENQNKELLKVEHLKKYFNTPGGVLHAVDDVSFSIRAGETLGVVVLRLWNSLGLQPVQVKT